MMEQSIHHDGIINTYRRIDQTIEDDGVKDNVVTGWNAPAK